MATPRRLLILGTRTFSEEVADLALDIPGVDVTAFVENLDKERCKTPLAGLPVIWLPDAGPLAPTHECVCALATTKRRRFADAATALGLRFTTLVHPSAHVSRSATIAEGTIVNALAALAARTTVGAHVIVNRGALIGHHTRIGRHVTIGPGVTIGGCSSIGDETFIGIGATIGDRVSLGSRVVVGAGTLVMRDVPDGTEVISSPGRTLRRPTDGR